MNKKSIDKGILFLIAVIILYGIVFIISSSLFNSSIEFFKNIFNQIYWVFILVFFLMVFFNYFFNRDKVIKYLGKGSGIKSWFFSVVFGIVSMGPIYVWYPLLNDLKEKGMRPGLIACFLYNRGIKLPLLPLMVVYFGLKYVFIVISLMIVVSIVYSLILEKFLGGDSE
ncbi:MAG: hypothetical protein ACOC1P_04985 [Minisyncoccales bacterium]